MAASADPLPDTKAHILYDQLLASWNSRDANGCAALFCEDGELVGFDGSQLVGREEIAAILRHSFIDHPTPAWVGIVRTVRSPAPKVAVLRAVAGMVPAGGKDIDPALNAVQLMVAAEGRSGWRIVSFQNTPAQFRGHPELAAALATELRQHLPAA